MSRSKREINRRFRVFCEGDTEYNYFEYIRKNKPISLTLKPVNMHGGGYSNFLDEVKSDSNTDCLAKFVVIDGDRAVKTEEEKRSLRELANYCIRQNQSKRIPHFLIVDFPDFEYDEHGNVFGWTVDGYREEAKFTYDENGNVISVNWFDNGERDGWLRNHSIRFSPSTYDEAEKIVA